MKKLLFNTITTMSCILMFVLFVLCLFEGMKREIRRREIVAEIERSMKEDDLF